MQLHTLISSENGPIILWVMYPHRGDELQHTADSIRELVGEEQFTLVAIQIDDWNRDLSPWRSDEVDGSFAGEAGRTLDYIEQQVVPQLDIQSQANRPLYIMGYSLAGLFALWAMYQTDIFAGCATCSGSMWYPGFTEYVNSQPTLANKRIYISLGGKESRTSDRLMSTVADRTKEICDLLKKDNDVIYEINPGGHFADSGKRLAKAVKWIEKVASA